MCKGVQVCAYVTYTQIWMYVLRQSRKAASQLSPQITDHRDISCELLDPLPIKEIRVDARKGRKKIMHFVFPGVNPGVNFEKDWSQWIK